MKNNIVLIMVFLAQIAISQTLSPNVINIAGGSGIVNAIHYDYTIGEPYTNFGGTSCDSIFSGFQHMAIDTLRVKMFNVTVNGNTTICQGSNRILTAQAGSSYTWSSGATTQTIIANTSGVYTASVTNTCSNVIVSNPIVITVLTPPTPDICEVTVDSLSNYNEIYWQKTLYPQADSFFVYREVSTNIYVKIGGRSAADSSMFIDTVRSIGPANGNPNLTSYKYKIQLKDSCDNYSAKSLWHQTIFVQDQQNGNFNWNPYAIESTTSPVSNYNLKRRDPAGVETLVGSTTSSVFTDPAYNTFWPLNYKWFVDALGFNCDPTLRVADPNGTLAQKVKTKSNHANDKVGATNVNSSYLNNLRIYPNPAKNKITVELGIVNENVSIELNNVLGQTLFSVNTTESINTINTSNYLSGVYFLNIKLSNKIIAVKKVVLQ